MLRRRPLIVCPPCNCICHHSMISVASRRYLTPLLSRSSTPHVQECVALAAARMACPVEPRPLLTWASALASSFVMRLVRSTGEHVFLCFWHLPFQIVCSLPRLPCIDAYCFMGCSARADLSKCAAFLKLGWRMQFIWFSSKNFLFFSSFRTIPGWGGCSQTLFSSKYFDCSIFDWEYEVSTSLRCYHFLCVERSDVLMRPSPPILQCLRPWCLLARFPPRIMHNREIYLARLLLQADAI